MSAQSDSLQSGTLKSHLWFTRVGNWSCHVETKHLWWIGLLRLISSAGSLLLSTGLLAKPAGASECLRWPLVRDHWLVYCCQKPTARKKKRAFLFLKQMSSLQHAKHNYFIVRALHFTPPLWKYALRGQKSKFDLPDHKCVRSWFACSGGL